MKTDFITSSHCLVLKTFELSPHLHQHVLRPCLSKFLSSTKYIDEQKRFQEMFSQQQQKSFNKCFLRYFWKLSNNKKVSTLAEKGENSRLDLPWQAFNVNPSMVVIVLMFIQSIHGCNCCPTFYGRAGFAPSATSLGLFPLAILSTQSYHQHLFHLFHSLSPSHSCCQAVPSTSPVSSSCTSSTARRGRRTGLRLRNEEKRKMMLNWKSWSWRGWEREGSSGTGSTWGSCQCCSSLRGESRWRSRWRWRWRWRQRNRGCKSIRPFSTFHNKDLQLWF